MSFDVLISKDKIAKRVEEIAKEVSDRHRDGAENLIVIGVLKGSFIFLADLVRKLNIPTVIHFVQARSYGSGTESSGAVKLTRDISIPLKGRDILLVEDIVDTGHTIDFLLKHFKSHEPKSVSVCALLHKPSREVVKVPVDHLGFTIEDHFVVGYGLDLDDQYRGLEDIVIYKGEE